MTNSSNALAACMLFCLSLVGCKDTSPVPGSEPIAQKQQPSIEAFQTYEKALAEARNQKKPILLVFTGSDWCNYSKALAKDILSTETWKRFADKSLVVYGVDLPISTKLPEGLLHQNQLLKDKLMVKGFPTLLLLDPASEQELARIGVIPDGTPEDYISTIRSAINGTASEPSNTTVKLNKGDIRATTGTDKAVTYLMDGYQQGEWTMDLDAAIEAARKDALPILLTFTDSDNCEWCSLMNEKVFSQASWQRFARNNLAMVAIDFREKPPLPEAMKLRNLSLKKAFAVQGYPTFVLVESDGKTLVSYIEHDLSPRGFRSRVKEALVLAQPNVNTAAQEFSAKDAEGYRKLVAEIKTARADKRKLDLESQELFMSGGITPEFSAKYNSLQARLVELESQLDTYARKRFSIKLAPKVAQRYLSLASELASAEINVSKLKTASKPDRDAIQATDEVINVIEARLADIEFNYYASLLPTDAADLYKKLFSELTLKRKEYNAWLATNPPSDELNNAQNTIYLQEIHNLQDRMDAIRDLQSNKGGPN